LLDPAAPPLLRGPPELPPMPCGRGDAAHAATLRLLIGLSWHRADTLDREDREEKELERIRDSSGEGIVGCGLPMGPGRLSMLCECFSSGEPLGCM